MTLLTPPLTAPEVHVNVGDAAVLCARGVLASIGLGSCIALMLYDREAKIGGLAHVLLPHEALSRAPGKPSKYANSVVPHLLELMRDVARCELPGGRLGTVEARLVGGASMFAALLKGGGVNMGERNVVATRRALVAAGIRIVAEDVGGDFGRSVYFDVASGEVHVSSIRHGDKIL